MKYFDYSRLHEEVDPALRTFLLSVFDTDTLRRTKVAFPEFFSDEPIEAGSVNLSDIAIRKRALLEAEEHNGLYGGEDFFRSTLSWFSIPIHQHEQRADREAVPGSHLLPVDFKLERNDEYDGLTSDNPWLVTLPMAGLPEEEHLVIEFLKTGEENPSFFLWTIQTSYIIF
jgi:hypothetical protein